MGYLATDKDGKSYVFNSLPIRYNNLKETNEWREPVQSFDSRWFIEYLPGVRISRESVIKLLGHELSFEDEPVEI